MSRAGLLRLSEPIPNLFVPKKRSQLPPTKTVTVLSRKSTAPACWAASKTLEKAA